MVHFISIVIIKYVCGFIFSVAAAAVVIILARWWGKFVFVWLFKNNWPHIRVSNAYDLFWRWNHIEKIPIFDKKMGCWRRCRQKALGMQHKWWLKCLHWLKSVIINVMCVFFFSSYFRANFPHLKTNTKKHLTRTILITTV